MLTPYRGGTARAPVLAAGAPRYKRLKKAKSPQRLDARFKGSEISMAFAGQAAALLRSEYPRGSGKSMAYHFTPYVHGQDAAARPELGSARTGFLTALLPCCLPLVPTARNTPTTSSARRP